MIAMPKRSAAAVSPIRSLPSKTAEEAPTEEAAAAIHVRLKPYNPRRGAILRKYVLVDRKLTFQEERGWYKVDAEVADYLATVRQVHGDELSLEAFDICTEAEAKAIDAREAGEKKRKDEGAMANDLTTRDLRERTPVDERLERAAEREKQARERVATRSMR